jgi:homocysteine S-methyltransferase
MSNYNGADAVAAFVQRDGHLLLDGGLATELEARGYSLDSLLWSAELLTKHPSAIADVHRSYLEAGASCLVTASYQASFEGFARLGIDQSEARRLMLLSVQLATGVRDEYVLANATLLQPLVAASIGPFGASLADGSEYRGDYGLDCGELIAFHRPRFALLHSSDADFLACETIPNIAAAEALAALFTEYPGASGWVSFSCRDGKAISDGTPLVDCAALFSDCPGVFAVGINCSAPEYIESLIREVHSALPDRGIVVYPNSGERYDGEQRHWLEEDHDWDCGSAALAWRRAGATLIGGCCRVGPEHIEVMAKSLNTAR